jgi:hypothetical protein
MGLKFKNRPGIAGTIFMLACILIIGAVAFYGSHKKNSDINSGNYLANTEDVPLPYWLSSMPELFVDRSKGDKRDLIVSAYAHPSDLAKTQEYYRQALLAFGWSQFFDTNETQSFVKADETLNIQYFNQEKGKLIVKFEVTPTQADLGTKTPAEDVPVQTIPLEE